MRSKLLILFSIIALDQITKAWAFTELKEKIFQPLIENIIEFRYAENTGAAFSFLQDYPQLLTIFICLVLLGMSFYFFKTASLDWAYVLILAGGFGNLIDRFNHGFVVDFINPLFINFAIFNIADIALNLGVYLILIQWLVSYFRNKN